MKAAIIILIAAVVGFLAYVFSRPSSFEVRRSISISAPAERVAPYVEKLADWVPWSPWEKLDPTIQRRYSGMPGLVGSMYHWKGSQRAGEGEMRVLEVDHPKRVVFEVEFFQPRPSKSQMIFDFVEKDGATKVTWTMRLEANFMFKLVTVFKNMEKAIGADFERGLGQLKALVEQSPPAAGATGDGGTQ